MKKVKMLRTAKGARVCFLMAFTTTIIVMGVAFACLIVMERIETTMSDDEYSVVSVTELSEKRYDVEFLNKQCEIDIKPAEKLINQVEDYVPTGVYLIFKAVERGGQAITEGINGLY